PAPDDRRARQHPGARRRWTRQAHPAGAVVGHDPQRDPDRGGMTMSVTVYLPDSEPGPDVVHLAASPTSLAGLRIAVLDHGKPNAALVMTRAAESLAACTGARVELVTKKGPQGRSANAAIPCAPDIFEKVLAQADVVITGTADCGSCTAYSVYDTIEL